MCFCSYRDLGQCAVKTVLQALVWPEERGNLNAALAVCRALREKSATRQVRASKS